MGLSKRHLLKTVTWRIVGTTDTLILSWLISGDFSIGLTIGFVEFFSKMILYYLHERFWYRINVKESNTRHVYKTFTWRTVGTLDTIIIAWIVSGNPFTGLKIGIVEVITKMVLYYVHEKVWYKTNYGLKLKNRKNK